MTDSSREIITDGLQELYPGFQEWKFIDSSDDKIWIRVLDGKKVHHATIDPENFKLTKLGPKDWRDTIIPLDKK